MVCGASRSVSKHPNKCGKIKWGFYHYCPWQCHTMVSSARLLAVNRMEHKHTNECNCKHYLHSISCRADPVQWFDMLTECLSVSFWKAIHLILLYVQYNLNPLQHSLTVCNVTDFTHHLGVLVLLCPLKWNLKKGALRAKKWTKEFKYIKILTKTHHPLPSVYPYWSLPQLSLNLPKRSQPPSVFLGVNCMWHP